MEATQTEGTYDALIIGCGMAGLAAGIRLSLFNQKVLILEKHNAPGGLNSYYFKNGRKFDVGLHAVTNYVEPGRKGTPFGKLLRQLRLKWEQFELAPQMGSRVAFPGVNLRFRNAFGELEASVAEAFPESIDCFRKLRQHVLAYDATDLHRRPGPARPIVGEILRNPLLEDMLFCPLMYYGSARENDIDFDQFVTLWKALFEEGFGRPLEGVRVVLRTLLDKYRQLGGKRRMRCGVHRILMENNRAIGVELENGEILRARKILSTAGWPETQVLCGKSAQDPAVTAQVGRLSFCEAIQVFPGIDTLPGGDRETIVFFNDSPRFSYERAREAIDLRSGVICFPGNYQYKGGARLPDSLMRVTMMANHAIWKGLPEADYRQQKETWYPKMLESALRFLPEFDRSLIPVEADTRDLFTPLTIERFSSHFGGAVYGSPEKHKDGQTGIENLFLAGTDQGFLGIVGAMLSGISMANRHLLRSNR